MGRVTYDRENISVIKYQSNTPLNCQIHTLYKALFIQTKNVFYLNFSPNRHFAVWPGRQPICKLLFWRLRGNGLTLYPICIYMYKKKTAWKMWMFLSIRRSQCTSQKYAGTEAGQSGHAVQISKSTWFLKIYKWYMHDEKYKLYLFILFHVFWRHR